LQAHDGPGSSLDQPAADPGATGDVAPGRWVDPQALPPLPEGPGSRVGPYKLLQEHLQRGAASNTVGHVVLRFPVAYAPQRPQLGNLLPDHWHAAGAATGTTEAAATPTGPAAPPSTESPPDRAAPHRGKT
jgi:hypothetical protein